MCPNKKSQLLCDTSSTDKLDLSFLEPQRATKQKNVRCCCCCCTWLLVSRPRHAAKRHNSSAYMPTHIEHRTHRDRKIESSSQQIDGAQNHSHPRPRGGLPCLTLPEVISKNALLIVGTVVIVSSTRRGFSAGACTLMRATCPPPRPR